MRTVAVLFLTLTWLCSLDISAFSNSPAENIEAELIGNGAGHKEYHDPDGWWQTIDYQCQVSFRVAGKYSSTSGNLHEYILTHKVGAVHFWGTAVDHFLGSTSTWNFDDTSQFDLMSVSGILQITEDTGEVYFCDFDLPTNFARDVQPYRIIYFGDYPPHIARIFIRLPSTWFFSREYDIPAEMTTPSVRFVFVDSYHHEVAVLGACTDGATEIKVRIRGLSAGTSASEIVIAPLAAQDGELIGEVEMLDYGTRAEQIYRVPEDFDPTGANKEATRDIEFMITAKGHSMNQKFTLTRPPVILVHGLWSDPSMWAPL